MNMTHENFCNFLEIDINKYQCSNCGIIIESDEDPPVFMCSFVDTNIGFYENLSDTEKELFCTKEQIDKRYNICQMCEYFLNNTCTQCGCKVVRNAEFKNKLFFKTQECPIGKWTKEN